MGRFVLNGSMLVLVGVAFAADTAMAQSLSVYERVRLNIASTANGGNPQFIGANPSTIAWTGSTVYVAGVNASGSTSRTAITGITNPLATPGLGVVPTFTAAFGTRSNTANGRGFTGLAVSGTVLASAWDNGTTTPATTDGMQALSTVTGGVIWTGSLSGRQMGGAAFDPGYIVSGVSQGGAGVTGLVYSSGRRPILDVATGTTVYGLTGSAVPGMVINTAPANTEWRDVDFDPATGDIYSRNANNVAYGIRTGTNAISGNAQQFLVNNANNGVGMAGQNLAFMSGLVDPAGSFAGNAVIWNSRPVGTTEGSTAFTTANQVVATTGATVPVTWNLLFGSTPAKGNGWYDFGYDRTTKTLAVMDFQNRTVSIFDLNVDVRTVSSGTATPTSSLTGLVPVAKKGGGTLVVDQAAAFAAGTVYVEEGTLQVGSGGTSGLVGSPVAITVSSGATIAFDRSDDYGGAFANQIGGGGGLTLRGGRLTLTGSSSYAGGTLVAGGTLAIGAGGTTGWVPGPIVNDGTVVIDRSGTVTFSGTISGSGGVVKAGSGSLTLSGSNTYAGPTRIEGGVLRLTADGQTGTGTIVPLSGGTLTIAPRLATTLPGLVANAGGLVDVGTGSVTVASGLSAAGMVAAILDGRGDGTWNGTRGISSSAVAADVAVSIPRAIGWLDNGDGSVAFAYSAPGDTNIDGQVDILDGANFLAGGKFDSGTPATWNEGDFGYDGVVDILDAADFLSTGLFDAGPYNAAAAVGTAPVAAVPEPAAGPLACGALLAMAAACRRARHTGHT
ncbi:MAG: autotransporter-associated beta strand repeat-containing protein [Planctomycetes bacterium]|nr:autotransporter-associated beta strand repeat-containing protein [Planctomycetota bacterium]